MLQYIFEQTDGTKKHQKKTPTLEIETKLGNSFMKNCISNFLETR